MPQRPPRKCLAPQCPVIGHFDGAYCDAHKAQQKKDRNAGRVYNAAWKRTREAILAQNPVCQLVDEYDVRCRRPGVIAHHVIAYATRPDLEHEQRNIVMLCTECHTRVTFNTDAELAARYVPTAWALIGIVQQEDIGLVPGLRATAEQAQLLWTLRNRQALFADVSRGDISPRVFFA